MHDDGGPMGHEHLVQSMNVGDVAFDDRGVGLPAGAVHAHDVLATSPQKAVEGRTDESARPGDEDDVVTFDSGPFVDRSAHAIDSTALGVRAG